jgi:hypothetical protein
MKEGSGEGRVDSGQWTVYGVDGKKTAYIDIHPPGKFFMRLEEVGLASSSR